MLVKMVFDERTAILDIARLCGCAPCQILIVNKIAKETDIKVGQEILVPVVVDALIKPTLS